jgi:hypothetical protein
MEGSTRGALASEAGRHPSLRDGRFGGGLGRRRTQAVLSWQQGSAHTRSRRFDERGLASMQ